MDAPNCLRCEIEMQDGIDNPTDKDLQRLDRRRRGRKVSNKDWESPTAPDSRTHLAYEAEHAADLQTEAILAAEVHGADQGDPSMGPRPLEASDENVAASNSETPVSELVADKRYHDNTLLAQCAVTGIRTYIPERRQKSRRWDDKPPEFEAAFRANRRRVQGERGCRLSRWRSERGLQGHICDFDKWRSATVSGGGLAQASTRWGMPGCVRDDVRNQLVRVRESAFGGIAGRGVVFRLAPARCSPCWNP